MTRKGAIGLLLVWPIIGAGYLAFLLSERWMGTSDEYIVCVGAEHNNTWTMAQCERWIEVADGEMWPEIVRQARRAETICTASQSNQGGEDALAECMRAQMKSWNARRLAPPAT